MNFGTKNEWTFGTVGKINIFYMNENYEVAFLM